MRSGWKFTNHTKQRTHKVSAVLLIKTLLIIRIYGRIASSSVVYPCHVKLSAPLVTYWRKNNIRAWAYRITFLRCIYLSKFAPPAIIHSLSASLIAVRSELIARHLGSLPTDPLPRQFVLQSPGCPCWPRPLVVTNPFNISLIGVNAPFSLDCACRINLDAGSDPAKRRFRSCTSQSTRIRNA